MEFRILGPLAIVGDDEQERPLRAAKQRALLALLLLHRNQAVPSERLVDWLWDGKPPATAPKTLQVYISELRKLLGEGRLETHGRGYLLRVEPGELDLDRFQALVTEAREADPQQTADLLRRALDLYRQEPLPELRYDTVAQSEIARLEELRLHTLERRIEADLALGRHAELVPELEALVTVHPLREQLRCLQMLALYRCGRQGDALAAYQAARRALDEQLGLEPGPALRQLERQILDHDPGLEAPATRARSLQRKPNRRPALLAAAGGALTLGAGIAAAVVVVTGGSPGLGSIAANSVGVIDPGSNRLVAQVPVGSGPTSVAVGDGAVWVANAGDDTLSRIDPKTRRVAATIGTGRTPSVIAAGGGAVWVANPLGETGTVSRVEPDSNQVVASVTTRPGLSDPFAPPSPAALAVGAATVWANGNPAALVVGFDAGSGKVTRTVFLGRSHSADGIAVGDGAVWISSSADDSVLRLDPRTRRVTPIAIASRGSQVAGPYGIAVGDGSVWVADSLGGTVSRIDPKLQAVAATIGVGLRPTNVVVGEGAVWVLNRGDGTVSRIDPKRNAVVATIHVGGRPTGIAAAADAVWVTVGGGAAAPVHVVAPKIAKTLPASSCTPVVYGGRGRPRFLLASDLPRLGGGSPSPVTSQMQDAIRLVLEQRHFRAGPYTVGYQACDDSTKEAGDADPVRCAANARLYAGDPSVLGLVGAYHSFCTGVELPITNTSPSGPLATLSPSNTYVGLTTSGPATTPLEPDEYYPSGVRSYARLVGNDQAQGAADAMLAKQLGLRRVYLLDDGTGTAVADATYTGRAAARLGLRVVGRSTWRPTSSRYLSLARRIAASGADGVYVGGCVCANGRRLLLDIKTVARRHLVLFAPDNAGEGEIWFGTSPFAGLYQSVAGAPVPRLPAAGRRFVAAFRTRYRRQPLLVDVVAAAQAAEILLDAIARSNGTRASVTRAMLATRVSAGELGSFAFDRNGDPTPAAISIYRFPVSAPRHKPPYVGPPDDGGVVDRVILAAPQLATPLPQH